MTISTKLHQFTKCPILIWPWTLLIVVIWLPRALFPTRPSKHFHWTKHQKSYKDIFRPDFLYRGPHSTYLFVSWDGPGPAWPSKSSSDWPSPSDIPWSVPTFLAPDFLWQHPVSESQDWPHPEQHRCDHCTVEMLADNNITRRVWEEIQGLQGSSPQITRHYTGFQVSVRVNLHQKKTLMTAQNGFF